MNEWMNRMFFSKCWKNKKQPQKTLEYIIKPCESLVKIYFYRNALWCYYTVLKTFLWRLGYHWIYHCNETVSINILEGTKIRTNIRASPGSKKCQQGNKCPISHDINDCTLYVTSVYVKPVTVTVLLWLEQVQLQ